MTGNPVERHAYLQRKNEEYRKAVLQRDWERTLEIAAMFAGIYGGSDDDRTDPSPELAEAFDSTASILANMPDEMEEAESFFKRSLDMRRTLYGEEDTWYAYSMANLASFYRAVGREDDALPLARKAEEIYRRRIKVLNELSSAPAQQGQIGDARSDPHEIAMLIRLLDELSHGVLPLTGVSGRQL